jgi:hypothetical protein
MWKNILETDAAGSPGDGLAGTVLADGRRKLRLLGKRWGEIYLSIYPSIYPSIYLCDK